MTTFPVQLLNISAHEEGSPVKKEKSFKLEVSQSKFFPRIGAEPFEPKTLSKEFFPMVGPNSEKVEKLLKETGYSLTVTTHQRLYGGPPPNWTGPPPGPGCQVFLGRIPKQLFEDTLVPIFAGCGEIWSMRLLLEGPSSPLSRGYGFVIYTTQEGAQNAQAKVCIKYCRLILVNVVKSMTTFLAVG